MELPFEHSQKIADGHNPAAYHTPDNQFQVLFTDGGNIKATYTETPFGVFEDREFAAPYTVADDEAVQYLRVTYLPRMNVFWSWESEGLHRLAMMILKQDGSPYLKDGTISYTDSDAVATLSLTLENPEGMFAAESWAGVTPGTRINVLYQMGNSQRIQIGMFYVDKIDSDVTGPDVSISSRNIIGKLLKDQTLDENNIHLNWLAEDFFGEILEDAGITRYKIQPAMYPCIFRWPRDKTYFDAITEAMQPLPNWKMREKSDGEVLIGNAETYGEFTEGVFGFSRNNDCFSRKVSRDDQHAYSRVCVHWTNRWTETVGEIEYTAEALGTGDGSNRYFYTTAAPIKPGITLVYIDGSLVDSSNYILNSARGRIYFNTPPGNGLPVTASFTALQSVKELEPLGEYDGATPLETRTMGRPLRDGTVEVFCKTTHGVLINLTGLEQPDPDVWYTMDMNTGEFTADYLQGEYYINYHTDTSQVVELTEEKYLYKDVEFIDGWNMPQKKTAYIPLPENMPEEEALEVLDELAERYARAGIIETFVARFTPHLQPGDTAEITEPGKLARQIGTVTNVDHKFGRSGFYTEFTVDSGGVIGKPRITDYIEKVASQQMQLRGLYRELQEPEE